MNERPSLLTRFISAAAVTMNIIVVAFLLLCRTLSRSLERIYWSLRLFCARIIHRVGGTSARKLRAVSHLLADTAYSEEMSGSLRPRRTIRSHRLTRAAILLDNIAQRIAQALAARRGHEDLRGHANPHAQSRRESFRVRRTPTVLDDMLPVSPILVSDLAHEQEAAMLIYAEITQLPKSLQAPVHDSLFSLLTAPLRSTLNALDEGQRRHVQRLREHLSVAALASTHRERVTNLREVLAMYTRTTAQVLKSPHPEPQAEVAAIQALSRVATSAVSTGKKVAGDALVAQVLLFCAVAVVLMRPSVN
jgi:hypothetical protein